MVEENFNKSKDFPKQSSIFVYDDFLSLNSMLSALKIGCSSFDPDSLPEGPISPNARQD
jgi:hypothetical protein